MKIHISVFIVLKIILKMMTFKIWPEGRWRSNAIVRSSFVLPVNVIHSRSLPPISLKSDPLIRYSNTSIRQSLFGYWGSCCIVNFFIESIIERSFLIIDIFFWILRIPGVSFCRCIRLLFYLSDRLYTNRKWGCFHLCFIHRNFNKNPHQTKLRFSFQNNVDDNLREN